MTGARTQPMASGPETLADGRYHLHRRIGAGGMGLILQATDTRLGREVAVKLLADNLAENATARERFTREARAAASLSNPHVVQVHDVGEQDGRPYLVMELVDGPSLADVLALDGPLDPRDVVDVAADTLAGVASAHAVGLLHRDLKPSNLLRTPDGLIKVTDFGVAQAIDAPELTQTGMVIGTAPYLAPERRSGQPATVRTDLFALGATLYELLVGRAPDPDGPLEALGDDVPAGLVHLLDRLLTHDPQQRPASAEAAIALLAGEVDVPRRPPTPPTDPSNLQLTAGPATVADAAARPDPERPSRDATARPDADAATAVADDVAERDEPPPHSPSVPWSLVVAVALGLLLAAVAIQALTGGDGPEPPAGVERTGDPAETARNLSEWLQERAED